MSDKEQKLLFQILNSERSILSRTDQKALTLLSVLGVFMVFFIVYYRLLVVNAFLVSLLSIYFIAAFLSIVFLLRTILPRFEHAALDPEKDPQSDPMFFGGIKDFQSSEEYHEFLMEVQASDERADKLLSRQIHSLAIINWIKNVSLRRGMYLFVIALGAELLMILSVFISMGMDSLNK